MKFVQLLEGNYSDKDALRNMLKTNKLHNLKTTDYDVLVKALMKLGETELLANAEATHYANSGGIKFMKKFIKDYKNDKINKDVVSRMNQILKAV